MGEQGSVVHPRKRESGAERVFILGKTLPEKLERLLPVRAPCRALEK
jgi:hypothetical protein